MNRRMNPVQTSEIPAGTVTVPSPTGPVEVTYGGTYGIHPEDRFRARYRGEDVMSSYLYPLPEGLGPNGRVLRESIVERIAKIEDEFQTKKRLDTARREAAKTPLPALLTPVRASSRFETVTGPFRLEPVHVRGIDQRNSNALIIRANGDKESVSPGRLLADLDQDDVLDAHRLYDAWETAQETATRHNPPGPRRVLEQMGVTVDLVVTIDPDTGTRSAEHDGRTYTAWDAKGIIDAVTRDLVAPTHPFAVEGSRDSETLVATSDTTDGGMYVFPSPEAYAQWVAAGQALSAANTAIKDFEGDHLFDLTLFTEVSKPQEPEPTTEPVTVGSVQAPAVEPEWDD